MPSDLAGVVATASGSSNVEDEQEEGVEDEGKGEEKRVTTTRRVKGVVRVST